MPHLMKPRLVLIAVCLGMSVVNASAQQNELGASLSVERTSKRQSGAVDFVRDIQPILRANCYECHAGTTEEGGLNLGIKTKALAGGDSGKAILVGQGTASLLVELVSGVDEDRLMPPEGNRPLTKKQVQLLRTWIDQGASWPDQSDVVDPKMDRAKEHWAFQRLTKIELPPQAESNDWSNGPIDRFIHHGLRHAGLEPSRPADARTLVRRIFFDLTGLPPTPEQVQRFIKSHSVNSDSAVAELVDQLLASEQYGERWGRHWLDVARYADSDGQEADADRPNAYTYRDFVIQALNDDMPYDQFVRWQIAGDEFAPDDDGAVAATGFLTAGPSFKLPDSFLESERLRNRYNELDDVISTLGSGLLGITVACARCHDHKYDAFSAKEYYQLLGVFHSGDRVNGKLPSGKEALIFQDFDQDRRTTWLFRRSDFYDKEIEVGIGFPAMLTSGSEANAFWQKAKRAGTDAGVVKSTLQRRALADWITDTEQGGGALLARVIVNRVWHHHFGEGIVRTTSDFGVRGDAPSHPLLLEYLASDFVRSGWKLKSLHQKILTSAVWQQSSTRDAHDPKGRKIDPENKLLWRMTPMRLEAEALRDAMLAVSGTLNLQAGGPGFKPYIAPEANLARNIKGERYPQDAKDDASTRRRSVFMFHKRLIPYPMFQAFDRPELMTSCARRQNTTVAPQAMVILNDRFVRAVARDFAGTLMQQRRDDPSPDKIDLPSLIENAFETCFCRKPTPQELEASSDFIEAQTAVRTERAEENPQLAAVTDYCQSLFGLNEFIYID